METKKHLWGHEIVCADRDNYSSRVFVIKEGEKTPYSYHKVREKTIFVLQGIVQAKIEGQNKLLNEGTEIHIPPKVMHGFVAVRGDVTILETGTRLVEDEVVIEES